MNSLPKTSNTASTQAVRRSQIMVVVSMYVGYATFMILRMAPTVMSTSIISSEELGIDKGDWGRIIAWGTIGAVVGKFIGGYAADRLGGRLTFAIGLALSAAGVLAFGMSSSVWMFQASLFFALMAKSAGWPAMTKIIVTSFKPSEYGRVWGVLATSSRVGTLIATFGIGALLTYASWRISLGVATAVGIAITIYFAISQRHAASTLAESLEEMDEAPPTIQLDHPLTGTRLFEAVGYFCRSLQFWLIVGSLVGLTIMWDFLLWVPQYLQDTCGLDDGPAAMASSAFPFGSLISVLVGGFVFDKLNRRTTAWVMGGLLTVAASCILAFYLMPTWGISTNASLNTSLVLLFIFGLCVSPCYYIPMSVFSIEFGGPHSGFLVALLDALAFGATAAFYYFAGEWAKESWGLFLGILLAVSTWAMLTTLAFMLREAAKIPDQ